MKDIIHNHRARFLVYLSLAVLSTTTLYGSFFLTSTYHAAMENRERLNQLEARMEKREAVAATYVPLLLSVKALVDSHQDILKRIMNRQVHINKLIEKPLEKRK